VVLAVWSLVMLVTFDKVTARPRRAVLGWLRARRHRQLYVDSLRGRCVCGWEVTVHGTQIRENNWVEPLPPGVDVPAAVAERLAAHVTDEQVTDRGWLDWLVTCSYCVAMWISVPVAGTAVLWADNRVWQATMLALGARAGAGALSAQLTPPDEADIEPGTP
jgi:hypothetical protein